MKLLRVLRILSALISVVILTAPAGGQIAFAPAVSYNPGPVSFSVAVADLRRNGKLDLVVGNYCKTVDQNGNCTTTEGGVSVLLGNGDGTFQPAVMYATGAPFAASIAVGDVNGDGVPDLVVGDVWQTFHQSGGFFPGGVSVLLGNGDGTFQPAVDYDSGGAVATSVAIGDVNGDRVPDLVVQNCCAELLSE